VALRVDAKIFAQDDLLEEAAIELPDDAPPASTEAKSDAPAHEPMTPEELEEYLRKLDPEDFGRFTP
jgi:hypothetical protein